MPRVLVVDDSPIDRRLVGEILRKGGGLEVNTVENGRQALAWIEQQLPDIVVTDLQMPELDGLQLVRALRIQCPEVPVLLITAHGSEELAIEALEHGAASYVPKQLLADKLLDTVEQLLARVSTDRQYEQLTSCMTRAEFSFSLENEPSLVERLVELVRQLIGSMRLYDASEQLRVAMALEESLLAAMFQGNLELSAAQAEDARQYRGDGHLLAAERRHVAPFNERRVLVDVRIGSEEARFVVRHQGLESDLASRLGHNRMLSIDDPTQRTLVLIHAFMDEVSSNDEGTEVTMIKRRESANSPVGQDFA